MNKKDLRKLIKELVADRNELTSGKCDWVKFHLSNIKMARTEEVYDAWKQSLDLFLEEQGERVPEYNKIIENLIKIYNERRNLHAS